MLDILQAFSFQSDTQSYSWDNPSNGVYKFTVVDICWTTNFLLLLLCSCLVFLSSLPFFIILNFCSHLPSSLTFSEPFSSWPPSAYLFYIFIFFYTFSFTCFDHLVMHSPHILTCINTVPLKSTWKETSQLLMILLFLCNERQDFESVLNSQDPSDPSDDFYSECFIKR